MAMANTLVTNTNMSTGTSPPQLAPYSTFHSFPKLPLEIRRQIWNESFEESRRVKVEVCLDVSRCDADFNYKYDAPETEYIRCISNPPVALSVNQESRNEAKEFYEKLFNNIAFASPIYFNPHLDTVCLVLPESTFVLLPNPPTCNRLRELAAVDMDLIRRLELPGTVWNSRATGIMQHSPLFHDRSIDPGSLFNVPWRYFHGLEHLTLISRPTEKSFMGVYGDDAPDCERLVRMWFEEEKLQGSEISFPEVRVVPCQYANFEEFLEKYCGLLAKVLGGQGQ